MIECNHDQIGKRVYVGMPGYEGQVYIIEDVEPRRNAAIISRPSDYRGHWMSCTRLTEVPDEQPVRVR